jgi:hypothetical protein
LNATPARVRAAALAGGLLLAAPALADPGMAVSQPYRLSPHVAPGERHMGIRLLGTVELLATSFDGVALGGLSGLAWDEDESRLYALSDDGAVFHLRPHIEAGILSRVDVLAAYALRGRDGRPLEGRHADAEGLVVQGADNGTRGDSVLAASFERFPRIVRLRPDGRFVDSLRLPEELRDIGRYARPNKALESLAWFPRHGFVTAPERPLSDDGDGIVAIFALDGGRWRYPLAATPNASLVALEALPNGDLLALERGHGLMFLPLVITLRHTRIDWSASDSLLTVATLAVLDTSQGWSVDNFEGLTRHRGLKFFMVSDDNFNHLQKTLLVYFELAGADDAAIRSNVPEFEPRQKTSD